MVERDRGKAAATLAYGTCQRERERERDELVSE